MKEQELKSYYRYWGKAEKDGLGCHLLPYHCLDVAAGNQVIKGKA
jgi:CRISPR-associated endonuclease/helicase Cas3